MPQIWRCGASRPACALVLSACFFTWASADDPPGKDASTEFDRAADRYWQLLTDRPQFGTAFQLCYRYYLDTGRLDELIKRINDNARQQPTDASAQLLKGLMQERQGNRKDAVISYRLAEQLDTRGFYPPYVLGQSLAYEEQFEDAIAAYRRSIERKPPKTILLEAYEQLGRLELRMGRREQGLATWDELVRQFPDELRILEELAEILREEKLYAESIERWKEIETRSRAHSYERMQARMQIADIEVLRDRPQSALNILGRSLAEVKPDSWLASEFRHRIEQVFQRDQNSEGLIGWCEKWLASHPEDVETQLYLATILARSGRHAKASEQYRQILKVAPSHRRARQLLIDELSFAGRYEEAIQECQILVDSDENDIDARRRLGQLHLASASDEQLPAARQRAITIWRQIADLLPDDPLLAVKAAELCDRAAQPLSRNDRNGTADSPVRQESDDTANPLFVAAEELYREAVRRSRGEPHYYEYLGEFLHLRGRRDEAVAAWAKTAEPPHETPDNWHRLAEIYYLFGYDQEAVAAGRKSLESNPEEFAWYDFQIELLLVSKQYEAALAQLPHLERLADSPERQRDAIHRTVQVYRAADRVQEEIDRLEQAVQAQSGNVRQHWTLALLLADLRKNPDAIEHLHTAVAQKPDFPPLLLDLAQMLERTGDVLAAVDQYEKLAHLDPVRRLTYYEKLIHLALRKKRPDLAKQAADRLIQLAPENSLAHRLWAEVAFQLNDIEAALEQLRRSVLISPREIEPRMRYAVELGKHGRAGEAREHYWRCFELSDSINERIRIVEQLTLLAGDAVSRIELIDRLVCWGGAPENARTLTLCLNQIYMQLQQYEDARRELTDYLLRHPDDLDVLEQNAIISEKLQDWRAAIESQERIVALSNDWRHVFTWARYYTELNRNDWLNEARENKQELFKKWADTFRRYRQLNTLPDDERAVHAEELKQLRTELQQLSWARDQFHRKEESLAGLNPASSRTPSGWVQLQAECETLEFILSHSPVTADVISQQLQPMFEKTRTRPNTVLNGLTERDFLKVRPVGNSQQYLPAGSREKLLERMAFEVGQRLIGGTIELSGEDLTRLKRIVRKVKHEE